MDVDHPKQCDHPSDGNCHKDSACPRNGEYPRYGCRLIPFYMIFISMEQKNR